METAKGCAHQPCCRLRLLARVLPCTRSVHARDRFTLAWLRLPLPSTPPHLHRFARVQMLHRDAVHRRAVHGAVLSAHGALIRAPDVTVSPFSTRSITDSSVRGLAVRRAPPQDYSGACSAGAASCRSAARPLPPLTRFLRCAFSNTACGPLAVPMSYPLTRCLPSPRVRSDPRRVRARRRCFEATRR